MLNVNSALYSAQGVDIKNVQNITNQILNNANAKAQPEVKAIDYSKFNRAVLGIDLYSSRTNSDLQKQISLMQAGLYAKAVNVAKLNSQAAANLYSASTVQKNVEQAQSVQTSEISVSSKVEELPNTIQLFNTSDKNSNSSNGFNPFQTDKNNSSTDEKDIV